MFWVGDLIVVGILFGCVCVMVSDIGCRVKVVGLLIFVEIIGLNEVL